MQGVSGSAALTDMVEAAIGHSITPNPELADLMNVVVFPTGSLTLHVCRSYFVDQDYIAILNVTLTM
jgi:hypothetical protein